MTWKQVDPSASAWFYFSLTSWPHWALPKQGLFFFFCWQGEGAILSEISVHSKLSLLSKEADLTNASTLGEWFPSCGNTCWVQRWLRFDLIRVKVVILVEAGLSRLEKPQCPDSATKLIWLCIPWSGNSPLSPQFRITIGFCIGLYLENSRGGSPREVNFCPILVPKWEPSEAYWPGATARSGMAESRGLVSGAPEAPSFIVSRGLYSLSFGSRP